MDGRQITSFHILKGLIVTDYKIMKYFTPSI